MGGTLTFETYDWEEDRDFQGRECAKEARKGILELLKKGGIEEECNHCEELILHLNNQAVISSRYEKMWTDAIGKCIKDGKAIKAMKEKLGRP